MKYIYPIKAIINLKEQFMNKYMLSFTLMLNILPESDAASAILAQTIFHIIVQLSSILF